MFLLWVDLGKVLIKVIGEIPMIFCQFGGELCPGRWN